MGRNFVTGPGPDQGWLMPADPREWLPARHLAWSVLEQAAEMDLSAFENAYRADGQGGAGYDPAVMCGLLLYCYCKGLRSSREIEMATFDDVGARVICGNLHPDHATAARFVRRHERAVRALLPESVKACAREGLVCLEVTAGDGTKLKANASMAANVTAEQLEAQIAELEGLIAAGVQGWVAEHLAADDAAAAAPRGPAAGDGGGDGGGGKKAPARAAMLLERRRAARRQLAARQAARSDKERGKLQARAAELAGRAGRKQAAADKAVALAAARLEAWRRKAASGVAPRGKKPGGPDADRDVRRTRAQADKARQQAAAAAAAAARPAAAAGPAAKVNTTDWASRVMPLKKGGSGQLINAQALATAGKQVILAIMRHDNPAGTEALHPLLEQARAVLDAAGIPAAIVKAIFDAGYASDANFTAAAEAELYVALAREAVQAGRASDGRQPETMLPSWQEMAARLATPEGKAVYKKRAPTIEPVFAQLTGRLGRNLNYRGNLIDAELHLWAVSHNLLKAITARASRTARQARAQAAAVPAAA